MFYQSSISQYSTKNLLIWFVMAFQAGLLNIGGLLITGNFISHVTGFVTFFGHHLVQGEWSRALGMLNVPVFFLLGTMVSGYFIDSRMRAGKNPKYVVTFGLMFVLILFVFLLGVMGGWGGFQDEILRDEKYWALVTLCFVCGVQNATISTVSRSVVRTTHLTGIVTDLGIGLVRIFSKAAPAEEKELNIMRIGIVSFFILGSIAGAFFYTKFLYWGFLLPTLIAGILWGQMIIQTPKKSSFNHSHQEK